MRESSDCSYCGGQGSIPIPGMIPCWTCDVIGSVMVDSVCRDCNGSGGCRFCFYGEISEFVECRQCEGEGAEEVTVDYEDSPRCKPYDDVGSSDEEGGQRGLWD